MPPSSTIGWMGCNLTRACSPALRWGQSADRAYAVLHSGNLQRVAEGRFRGLPLNGACTIETVESYQP